MKKFLLVMISVLLIAAVCAACTPGTLVDTLNGLGGATPGNGLRYATPGSAASIVSPGNLIFATPINAASPGNAQ